VTASLWRDLILDHDGSKACLRITANGAFHIECIAIACVPVANDRDGDGGTDVAALVDDFAIGDETRIRCADTRGRHGEA